MGKVAARVMDPDGSLLARTLASKYTRLDLYHQNRKHSKIWKIIKLGSETVDKHANWMIGNGLNVSTLEDNWIGPNPISKWPTFYNMNVTASKVSRFLDAGQAWNTQALLDSFGPILAAVITLIPRDHIGNSDRLVWNPAQILNDCLACCKQPAANKFVASPT